MPRITAELVSARPIDIAFIDGVETVSGGEGPWIRGYVLSVLVSCCSVRMA